MKTSMETEIEDCEDGWITTKKEFKLIDGTKVIE
jgi:hypothetical protein